MCLSRELYCWDQPPWDLRVRGPDIHKQRLHPGKYSAVQLAREPNIHQEFKTENIPVILMLEIFQTLNIGTNRMQVFNSVGLIIL